MNRLVAGYTPSNEEFLDQVGFPKSVLFVTEKGQFLYNCTSRSHMESYIKVLNPIKVIQK